MKTLCLSLISFLFFISCKSKEEIAPNNLAGKWIATGLTQSMNQDSTWSAWHVNPTFASVTPSIWEFTSSGDFLIDGKPAATCCFAGNKYSLTGGNKITFTELEGNCADVRCITCYDWDFAKEGNDTLLLRQCTTRSQFVSVK